MSLSDPIVAVGSVFRRRPSDILPLYMLGAAVPAIVRVVPFFALIIGYYYLASTGRLEPLLTELEGIDMTPPANADPNSEAYDAWASQFEPVADLLITPTTIALVLGAFLVSFVLGIVLNALVAAGQLAACYGRLRDERGLVAGVEGARRYWGRFVWLYVLEFVLWGLIIFGGGTAAAILVAIVSAADPTIGVGLGLLVGLLLVVALVVVRALFAFAPVAVVVDDAGTLGSVSRAAGFVRAEPAGAVFYCLVAIGAMIALSILSILLVFLEVVTVISLLLLLLVVPALHLLKSAVYMQYRERLTPPQSPDEPLQVQIGSGLRRGWTELIAFVQNTLGAHAFVVALGVVSFVAGWYVADPYVGTVETSITARLEGHFPPTAAAELFGNNMLVAMTTAFGGVALAIPALVSLVFNGVFLGAIARLEVAPLELLTFVIPHGILEIPAIFVASVVGISLGISWWQAIRGRIGRVAFADRLERAFWVLVGVGILLLIAALIEGFVSPYVVHLADV